MEDGLRFNSDRSLWSVFFFPFFFGGGFSCKVQSCVLVNGEITNQWRSISKSFRGNFGGGGGDVFRKIQSM